MGDISDTKKLIIIGGGAVGMAVATRAQRRGGYHVTVISRDSHTAYSQCGIPFVLGKEIKDFNSLIVRSPEFFKEMGIDIRLNTQVDSINLEDKTVVADGQMLHFDKLVIATGSVPCTPENISFDRSLDNVFTVRTLSDGLKIEEALKKARNLMIIGGGSIGVELAPGMAKRGINTRLVNRSDFILSRNLDPDMAEIVREHIESMGVDMITGVVPTSINGRKNVESVTIEDKDIPADVVILAMGVIPETSLARSAGISIGNRGAIMVNEHFQVKVGDTYLPDVFAGGECVEIPDFITGKPVISQLASTARRMAEVIADNLYEKGSTFDPVTNPWVCVAGKLQIGTVGLTNRDARENGIEVISGSSKGLTGAGYYPGSGQIFIKLLFKGRYLAGAQVIADKGVKERIDGLAFAIRKRSTIDEMMKMETCYSPPVSTLVDPIIYAVKDAYKKLEDKN